MIWAVDISQISGGKIQVKKNSVKKIEEEIEQKKIIPEDVRSNIYHKMLKNYMRIHLQMQLI